MKRRTFLKQSSLAGCACLVGLPRTIGADGTDHPELEQHRIDRVQFLKARFHWPRLVGKNARIGVHGQHKTAGVVKVFTDKGAMGWGLSGGGNDRHAQSIKGMKVGELIDPDAGIRPATHRAFDFALHDLAGVILNKPVYQLLGAKGPKATQIYSGMVYFDELEPPQKPSGLGKVMANCQWDVDYGYRQLKVKIGRGGRWYPHDQGLKTDIEIVNRIHETFKEKSVGILVDANDMYSVDDAIAFLKGVRDVPLFWFEEPFPEQRDNSKRLRDWMHANGFAKTFLADGERDPDPEFCMQLAREGILDVNLHDVQGYGLTPWRNLMPKLQVLGTFASPHAWGSRLKTHYCSHIAAGLGNCCTIEGVTCESDEIDFGNYPIIDGKIRVSDAPGFGMKLLV